MNHRKRFLPSFSLSHLLILVFGVAIGFLPLHLWRSQQPPPVPPVFSVDIRVCDVPLDLIAELGLPDLNDEPSILSRLSVLEEQEGRYYFSTNIQLTAGKSTRMETGMGYNFPVVANDGTPGVARRYEGNEFDLQCDELENGNLLLTFDIVDTKADYAKAVTIGKKRVPSDGKRQVSSQVIVPKDRHVAVAGGKQVDRDGVERELILIFSGKRMPRK